MNGSFAIPIPVHPDERHLPVSCVRLLLGSGIVELNVPVQGPKTLQNVIDTLVIWKPTIVVPNPGEHYSI